MSAFCPTGGKRGASTAQRSRGAAFFFFQSASRVDNRAGAVGKSQALFGVLILP